MEHDTRLISPGKLTSCSLTNSLWTSNAKKPFVFLQLMLVEGPLLLWKSRWLLWHYCTQSCSRLPPLNESDSNNLLKHSTEGCCVCVISADYKGPSLPCNANFRNTQRKCSRTQVHLSSKQGEVDGAVLLSSSCINTVRIQIKMQCGGNGATLVSTGLHYSHFQPRL